MHTSSATAVPAIRGIASARSTASRDVMGLTPATPAISAAHAVLRARAAVAVKGKVNASGMVGRARMHGGMPGEMHGEMSGERSTSVDRGVAALKAPHIATATGVGRDAAAAGKAMQRGACQVPVGSNSKVGVKALVVIAAAGPAIPASAMAWVPGVHAVEITGIAMALMGPGT